MKKIIAALASVMLTTGVAQAQNLLVNGGFEAPVVAGSCCITAPPGTIPGWTVTTGDVNVVNGNFSSTAGNLAFEGLQYLDLIGEANTGGLSQTFATTAGLTYELSFAYSHNLFGGLAAASGTYDVQVGSLFGTVTHSTGSTSDLDWQNFTSRFVAGPGSTSTLTFVNTLSGDNAGLFLDAVSVAAVPEPAAWAMMIGGFGLVGGALRRRRSSVAYA